ncbi:hypothetical protein NSB25_20900 [Acetatifactor muris]|uniref:dUTP diphosphatase n=1 Tax=Acetatifactor muris TaxID=879566 RepID=A0A2K4ZLX0_9FIRM|nr:hypothetical protein [Acetatifactor muris]MCR2049717.1 hypothetical protein [Acetatifactor muris]SOY31479.1 Deoxyuridine 5'-triphosphate nucleotidohydrolase [Acetatifactor muris]
MKKVAQFEKVSLKQFLGDWIDTFGNRSDHIITEIYKNIKLPIRKTKYSAGHDFFTPCDIRIKPGDSMMIPTGIRCQMNINYVMLLFPRSSLGIKKHMAIANTIPVIDADYINADNEGHIFICIRNYGDKELEVKTGEAFVQAVFVEYGSADNNKIDAKRNGGIGSTGK